jgi:hypothetical protein
LVAAWRVSDWLLPDERALGRQETSCPRHVHGADYFARHLEAVEAALAGDRIFLPTGAAIPTSAET